MIPTSNMMHTHSQVDTVFIRTGPVLRSRQADALRFGRVQAYPSPPPPSSRAGEEKLSLYDITRHYETRVWRVERPERPSYSYRLPSERKPPGWGTKDLISLFSRNREY